MFSYKLFIKIYAIKNINHKILNVLTGDEKQFGANGFSYHHRKSDAWIGAAIDVEDEENGRVVVS